MSINRMIFVIVALLLSAGSTHAELGIGHIASEWDPQTKEFKEVYKDWQEGVVTNLDTGNYTITYKDDDTFSEVVFEPSTKIDPALKSKFHVSENKNIITYRYKLKNGKHSKQNIDTLITNINSAYGDLKNPKDWVGRTVPNSVDDRLRLSWIYDGNVDLGGLKPNEGPIGFSLESFDLPGIGTAQITGAARPTTWLGIPDPASAIGKQVNNLQANNFVLRPAAVPLIPVPNPFDAAAVLTSMQKHVNQDLVSMKLIDPAFASQLDRLFQTAIAAAKGSNTVALKGNLKDLRHMLKREHADVDKDDEDGDDDAKDKEKDKSRLIDKLAAKVLDFDLQYIEKRLKAGKDD
ncbi:MAG: hypothetical protein NUV55_06930 [Sulfuricaulis sp.]|uniref:hypothetical protein n=1 Tax=Sulfuricaulis sp. TaxID=2003553 RepID=UPI0025F36538|nr:hypothetical protein [Sulfuricaulis sp.]MCR4346919.1 hypothetical protein [Sulfuricaulis sp.]